MSEIISLEPYIFYLGGEILERSKFTWGEKIFLCYYILIVCFQRMHPRFSTINVRASKVDVSVMRESKGSKNK